jgi:arylsulfatase A-like enzyme
MTGAKSDLDSTIKNRTPANIRTFSLKKVTLLGLLGFFLFAGIESVISMITVDVYPLYYLYSSILWLSLTVGSILFPAALFIVARKLLNIKRLTPLILLVFYILLPLLIYSFLVIMMRMPGNFYSISNLGILLFALLAFWPLFSLVHSFLRESRGHLVINTVLAVVNIAVPSIFGVLLLGSEFQSEQWKMSLLVIFLFCYVAPYLLILTAKILMERKWVYRIPLTILLLAAFLLQGNIILNPILRDYSFSQQTPKTVSIHGIDAVPNIILIVMDTARASSMSLYGYDRSTTPRLKELAEDAVVFDHATSSAPWTLPSHASLFTGLPSYLHFATHGKSEEIPIHPLEESYQTLAELLAKNGYDTGAVIANTGVLAPRFGIGQGFGYYWWGRARNQYLFFSTLLNGLKKFFPSRSAENWKIECGIFPLNNAGRINDISLDWLHRKTTKKKPWFLFINYMETHGIAYLPPPYSNLFTSPPMVEIVESRHEKSGELSNLTPHYIERLRGWYDNEMAALDFGIGQLIDRLKASNLYNDTLIIITSDHGELLGEHNELGHEFFLYQELLHVPLIVKYPNGEKKGTRKKKIVQNIDIFAEILSRAGIGLPQGTVGQPFDKVVHPILSEVYRIPASAAKWPEKFSHDLKALFSKTHEYHKLIYSEKGHRELFDILTDPRENNPLGNPDIENTLVKELINLLEQFNPLRKHLRKKIRKARKKLDKASMERLKTLGYVDK